MILSIDYKNVMSSLISSIYMVRVNSDVKNIKQTFWSSSITHRTKEKNNKKNLLNFAFASLPR